MLVSCLARQIMADSVRQTCDVPAASGRDVRERALKGGVPFPVELASGARTGMKSGSSLRSIVLYSPRERPIREGGCAILGRGICQRAPIIECDQCAGRGAEGARSGDPRGPSRQYRDPGNTPLLGHPGMRSVHSKQISL